MHAQYFGNLADGENILEFRPLHPSPVHQLTSAIQNFSRIRYVRNSQSQEQSKRFPLAACLKFFAALMCALTSNEEMAVNLTFRARDRPTVADRSRPQEMNGFGYHLEIRRHEEIFIEELFAVAGLQSLT